MNVRGRAGHRHREYTQLYDIIICATYGFATINNDTVYG